MGTIEVKENYPKFFTATILEWRMLLKKDVYKDIIIDSMRFLVRKKRVIVYGFVIMPNHVHIIWQIQIGHRKEDVQRDFMKYTAQTALRKMMNTDPASLPDYHVSAVDRKYQFWERKGLSTDLFTRRTLEQKLKYIHENPLQEIWKLCKKPEDYKYSSAAFYEKAQSEWEFLTHYKQ